jgi:hypothetical protein
VAYELNYFFDRREQTADELVSTVLRGVRESGIDAALVDVGHGSDWPQGLDWVSGRITSGGKQTGIAIEVHADEESVDASWFDLADAPDAPVRPAEVLALCTLTLIGDVDWPIVETLRTHLREGLSAVEHDQADGFS